MRVKIDCLQGPVLGHKMRCQVLEAELIGRGHTIVLKGDYDWLVVDYPADQFPESTGERRLVMGIPPQGGNDYSWNPLGDPGYSRTLYGGEYIIVSPLVAQYTNRRKDRGLLVTCGGADPAHLSEKIIAMLPMGDIVIGPNFGREVEIPNGWESYHGLNHEGMIEVMSRYEIVLCAWGGTTFEALAMGAKVVTISINDTYTEEARRLGMAPLTLNTLQGIPLRLAAVRRNNYGVDTRGVTRTVQAMERWLDG